MVLTDAFHIICISLLRSYLWWCVISSLLPSFSHVSFHLSGKSCNLVTPNHCFGTIWDIWDISPGIYPPHLGCQSPLRIPYIFRSGNPYKLNLHLPRLENLPGGRYIQTTPKKGGHFQAKWPFPSCPYLWPFLSFLFPLASDLSQFDAGLVSVSCFSSVQLVDKGILDPLNLHSGSI